MGLIKNLLLISAAAVAGVYLSSKEGAETRKKIKKHLESLTPVIKDLLDKTEDLLDSSQEIKSDEIRANLEKKIDNIKIKLSKVDAKKISDKASIIIENISREIRGIRKDINTENNPTAKKTPKKTNVVKIIKTKKATKQKAKSA
jgi:predicted transcriptional regulator